MSESETIHISMMKNWVSRTLFLRKRRLIVYLAALKKGAIRPSIRTMSYIGSYPLPRDRPTHQKWSVTRHSVRYIVLQDLYSLMTFQPVLNPSQVRNDAKIRNRYNQVPHLESQASIFADDLVHPDKCNKSQCQEIRWRSSTVSKVC